MSDSKTGNLNFNITEKLDKSQIHDIDYLQFKSFIHTILKNRAQFSDYSIARYTNLVCLSEFMRAFTHPSFDTEKNYEYYEILGDKVINYMMALLLDEKYPELSDMYASECSQYLTRLLAKYVDKTRFHELSNKFGFTPFIRFKEYRITQSYSGAKEDNRIRLRYGEVDLREDVFEAFWGCLNTLMHAKEPSKCGPTFVFEILKSFVDEYEVLPKKLPNLSELGDPTSMMKELWDRKDIKESGSTYTLENDMKVDTRTGNWIYKLVIRGLGSADKEYILSRPSRGYSKNDAFKDLNSEAMTILERDYQIKWEFKPKERDAKILSFEGFYIKLDEEIKEEDVHDNNKQLFKDWIYTFFKEKLKFNDIQIQKYTDEESMKKFERAVTHRTYNLEYNYSYYKNFGDYMKNYITGTYCHGKYKEIKDIDPKIASDILTKIIQTLDNKYEEVLSEECDDIGLTQFVRYKGYTKYRKDVPEGKFEIESLVKKEVFFSLLGCMNSIINQKENLKIGFIPSIQYVYTILDDKKVLPDKLPTAAELADATTKVKEIWDKPEMNKSGSRRTLKDELVNLKDEEKGVWRFVLHIKRFRNKLDGSYEKEYILEKPMTTPKNDVLKQFNQDVLNILEKEYGIVWISKTEVVFP